MTLIGVQVVEYNPSQCLDWLAVQTPRNKLAHSWVLQNMENWVERFLLAHNYPRVRTCKTPRPYPLTTRRMTSKPNDLPP